MAEAIHKLEYWIDIRIENRDGSHTHENITVFTKPLMTENDIKNLEVDLEKERAYDYFQEKFYCEYDEELALDYYRLEYELYINSFSRMM